MITWYSNDNWLCVNCGEKPKYIFQDKIRLCEKCIDKFVKFKDSVLYDQYKGYNIEGKPETKEW